MPARPAHYYSSATFPASSAGNIIGTAAAFGQDLARLLAGLWRMPAEAHVGIGPLERKSATLAWGHNYTMTSIPLARR